jgi:hypothetical protein
MQNINAYSKSFDILLSGCLCEYLSVSEISTRIFYGTLLLNLQVIIKNHICSWLSATRQSMICVAKSFKKPRAHLLRCALIFISSRLISEPALPIADCRFPFT